MTFRTTATATATLLATLGLGAVETELRLGPEELVVDSEFLSKYVDQGALRTNALTWRNHARARYFGFGLEADVYLLLEDSSYLPLDAGEFAEATARLDYLWEIEGYAQVMPYLRYQYFPEFEDEVDEPLWFGLEGWYLLPVEGLEAGGSINADVTGENGWWADVGMRELFQMAPLDFQAWQVINFGDEDWHRFTSGADVDGIGSLEIGMLATLPLPWPDTYATIRSTFTTWFDEDDRDPRDEDYDLVIGAGFEWRPGL